MKTTVVEIWKDVKGFEGLYQVSSLGQVKSLNYRHQKGVAHILFIRYAHKQRLSTVKLYRDGAMYSISVNRLVAETFITGANMNYDIIHKDGNYKNNSVNNLEVSTKKPNPMNSGAWDFPGKSTGVGCHRLLRSRLVVGSHLQKHPSS